jgi:hypothetical protein
MISFIKTQIGLATQFKGDAVENPMYEWILTILGGIIAMLGVLHRITLSGFSHIPGDIGDSRFNNFIFEHAWRWLLQKPLHSSFWDLPIFYPQSNTLAYSDLMVSFGPFYWIWRSFCIAPDAAYLGWFLTVGYFNYFLSYILLRKVLNISFVASALGAFIIAFSASRIEHIGQPQLFPLIYVLCSLITSFRYFYYFSVENNISQTFKRRLCILGFFTCIVLQFYGGFYNGYFIALLTGICCLVALSLKTGRGAIFNAIKKDWMIFLSCIAISVLALIPLASHYLEVNNLTGSRSWDEIQTMLPRPQSWIYCGFRTYLYRWMNNVSFWQNLPMRNEHGIGAGLITTIVMIYGFYINRKRTAFFLITMTALSTILLTTLIGQEYTLWKIVYHTLPGASALRAVSRIGLLVIGIPAGIGIALYVDSFHNSKSLRIAVLIAALCCVEQKVADLSYNYLDERKPIDHIVGNLDTTKEVFILTANGNSPPPPYVVQIDAMIATLSSNVPTINGYSGNYPAGWSMFWDANTESSDSKSQFRENLFDWSTTHSIDINDIQWIELDAGYRNKE